MHQERNPSLLVTSSEGYLFILLALVKKNCKSFIAEHFSAFSLFIVDFFVILQPKMENINMRQHIIRILFFLFLPISMWAEDSPNARQARQMFDRTYQMVFGEQGCTLHYDVNLIGLYKTNGTIWYKGDKSKFVEKRYSAWNNGQTYHVVDTKKKTVTTHSAQSDEKDKYSSKFKFSPDSYNYQVEDTKQGFLITLKLKKGHDGMKLIKALIDKKTRAPISLKIKVAFIWANIKISHFQSGNIDNNIFVFPKNQYRAYTYIDKRK